MAKLEFPRFTSDDLTKWFNRVNQFFEFQGTLEAQKVSLASYHLEGEANQWWQWIRMTFREEGCNLSWANFEDELWAHFGPLECEDFDEALSRIRQDDGIQMFKPRTLKEAISLARMKDDQLTKHRRFARPAPPTRAPLALPPVSRAAALAPTVPIWRLTWMKCSGG
ncbi:hypothetical protein F0562_029189 [Nyssa sinensis]|uniref:Retrotransposon gag domain-containing protein n=1 Tax=Nyssa sinensis TaxID=561372 RepID=A0A5J5B6B9_9ASTE|nr:hypothetical protein F0562_029189 [Nyssa sinensis]